AQRRPTLEPIETAPRPDERLLDGVFGLESRTEHAVAVRGQLHPMLLEAAIQLGRGRCGGERRVLHERPWYRPRAAEKLIAEARDSLCPSAGPRAARYSARLPAPAPKRQGAALVDGLLARAGRRQPPHAEVISARPARTRPHCRDSDPWRSQKIHRT